MGSSKVRSELRIWEQYPELPEALPSMREQLQKRARHKRVRYLLFRLMNEAKKGKDIPSKLDGVDLPPGFVDHFLTAEIRLLQLPTGQMARIVDGEIRTPSHPKIGGFATFASKWDVNEDLEVYSRHRSIWQEWRSTLERVVPILGQE